MSRREFLEAFGWGAAALAMTPIVVEACGNGNATSTSATPKKGGHVTFAISTDIAGLNPLTLTNLTDRSIGNLLFDPLVFFDDNQNPVPILAEGAPKASSDGLSYTFKLRSNLKWSDGQPLTADDVVWTYSLIYDPKYASFRYPQRATAVKYIDSVTSPEPQTVVIRSKSVYAPLLLQFGILPILPKHVLGTLDANALNTAPFNSAPTVWSGPFKFVKWDKGSQVVLARNDNYYRGAPYLDSAVWRIVSPTALASALSAGDGDIGLVTVTDLSRAEASGNLTVENVDSAFYYYIAFNLDPSKKGAQLFGDKAVRQALMYGLDRKSIGDAVYFGKETIVDSPIPADSWAHTKPKTQYRYDQAKAEQMLDAAGWTKNAQGIRQKNGIPMTFQVVVSSVQQDRVTFAEALTKQWQSVGVNATPNVVVFAEWLNQIQNVRTFDALLLIYPWGGADPDQSTVFASSSTAKSGFNCMDYKNQTLDQVLNEAVTTLDRSKRKSLYAQFSDIVMDELPALPILSFGTLEANNKRVQGVKAGPVTSFINWYWMKDVWVNDGK
jgi:peptide/nickel transport system substrate-binding protein